MNEFDQFNIPSIPMYCKRVQFIHVKEGRRIITIAYRFTDDNFGVEFAGSIFRKDYAQEEFIRKWHNETALGRLITRPLHTRYNFSHADLELLNRPPVRSKEERAAWSKSEVGQKWIDDRHDLDRRVEKFLRNELKVANSCKAIQRLSRDDITKREKLFSGVKVGAEHKKA